MILEALNDNPADVAKTLLMLQQANDLGCAQVLIEKPSAIAESGVVIDRLLYAAA